MFLNRFPKIAALGQQPTGMQPMQPMQQPQQSFGFGGWRQSMQQPMQPQMQPAMGQQMPFAQAKPLDMQPMQDPTQQPAQMPGMQQPAGQYANAFRRRFGFGG